MTTRRTSVILASALAAVLLPGAARAMDEEFYVNTYRSIGTVSARGQRSSGMGRTGAGLADGAASLGINPAGLGAFTGYSVEGGIGFDSLDDGIDSAGQTSLRLGGALSLETMRPSGGANQSVGGMLVTENFGGAGGVGMKRDQTGVAAGYGIHLLEDLVAGVSAALFSGGWKSDGGFDRSFAGGEFKLGAIYRLGEQLTAGGVLGYSAGSYNEKAAVGTGSGSLNRWNIRTGVGYQLRDETLLAGDLWYDAMRSRIGDVFDERNSAWGLSVGVEQQVLPDTLALRGGLYYDRTSFESRGAADPGLGAFGKSRIGFTAGAAVKLYSFDVGYSLDVNTKGDIKNLLDISAEW